MMDVKYDDFSTLNSVNFLCLIWAVMCLSLLKHVQFPKPIKNIPKEKN